MEEDDHRGPEISPLFIGLVGILAGAIIVATLHCITVSCSRQRQPSNSTNQHQVARSNHRVETPSSTSSTSTSTSNSTGPLITVYRYSKECRESTCAVCLSEFKEGEEVRVLPECAHQFHVMCVDMWLFSHPNCPLCRAETTALQQYVVVSLPDSGGAPPPELPRMLDFGG